MPQVIFIRIGPSGRRVRVEIPDPVDPVALANMLHVTFAPRDLGNVGGVVGIDWSLAQKQRMRMVANVTLGMAAPAGQTANYALEIVNAGGFNVASWGVNTRSRANLPIDGDAESVSVASLYWNGSIFTVTSIDKLASPATSIVT
jgi:hypothetical protein